MTAWIQQNYPEAFPTVRNLNTPSPESPDPTNAPSSPNHDPQPQTTDTNRNA